MLNNNERSAKEVFAKRLFPRSQPNLSAVSCHRLSTASMGYGTDDNATVCGEVPLADKPGQSC